MDSFPAVHEPEVEYIVQEKKGSPRNLSSARSKPFACILCLVVRHQDFFLSESEAKEKLTSLERYGWLSASIQSLCYLLRISRNAAVTWGSNLVPDSFSSIFLALLLEYAFL